VGALEVGVGPGRRARGHELVGTAALAAATVAATEELHGVGDDLHRLALGAVLRIPLAPFETAVHSDRPALREVLRAALALVAPDRDVAVVRLLRPLPVRAQAGAPAEGARPREPARRQTEPRPGSGRAPSGARP